MAAGELARCVERGGAALCGKALPGLLLVEGFERATTHRGPWQPDDRPRRDVDPGRICEIGS